MFVILLSAFCGAALGATVTNLSSKAAGEKENLCVESNKARPWGRLNLDCRPAVCKNKISHQSSQAE